ncbi:hypothetical protein [Streptomyces sp. NPDC093149]|uniref:hypothetical protein n=1 Tax=Streptomyces sp. NPDC093149 TaxID=3366031 RepID=UPI0038214329
MADRLQGEGVVARLRVEAAQRGDGDDDPFGDVREQRGHPRLGGDELGGPRCPRPGLPGGS